jgi:hypothetical protein
MCALPTERESQDRRRRIARIVATVVILLLLLVCCWISLWPLDADEEDAASSRVRRAASGSVTVDDVTAEVVDDLDFGRKGVPVRLSCTMIARATDTMFDAAVLSLRFDSVSLPPVSLGPEGIEQGLVIYPDSLPKGEPTPVAAVFAAPAGSSEATLVVQFPDMSPAEAIEVPVRFEAGDDR